MLPSWLLQPWMVAHRQLRSTTGSTARGRAPASCIRRRSSTRSTSCATGTGSTAGAASPSTKRCCPGRTATRATGASSATLRARGGAVYLCVIKDCGPEGKGMLSFPKPGVSYALDIPDRSRHPGAGRCAQRRRRAPRAGASTSPRTPSRAPQHFRAMEPRLDAWNAVRRAWDPHGRLKSAQSMRLLGDRP